MYIQLLSLILLTHLLQVFSKSTMFKGNLNLFSHIKMCKKIIILFKRIDRTRSWYTPFLELFHYIDIYYFNSPTSL